MPKEKRRRGGLACAGRSRDYVVAMPWDLEPGLDEAERALYRFQLRFGLAMHVIGGDVMRSQVMRVLVTKGGGWSAANLATYLRAPRSTVRAAIAVQAAAGAVERGPDGRLWVTQQGVYWFVRTQREAFRIAAGHQRGFSAEVIAEARRRDFRVQVAEAETIAFAADLPFQGGAPLPIGMAKSATRRA